jgi:hypothetical protein
MTLHIQFLDRLLRQQISVLQSQVQLWKTKEGEVRKELQNPNFQDMDMQGVGGEWVSFLNAAFSFPP